MLVKYVGINYAVLMMIYELSACQNSTESKNRRYFPNLHGISVFIYIR